MQTGPSVPDGQLADVLPPTADIDAAGHLSIGGCRLSDLADAYGTPVYVLDEDALRGQARRFRHELERRWSSSRVVFASKAFPSTAIYRLMAEEGVGADVAGGGELAMALAGGMDPASIIVHGNAKTDAELRMAVEAGVGLVVIDNFDELDRLEAIVTGEQGVLVRVLPNVHPQTHDAISTGQQGSKFGLPLPEAAAAISRLRRSDHLRLDGVHVHLGSQILDTAPWAAAVERVAALGDFDVYDLGGGLGVKYTRDQSCPSVEAWLGALTDAARRHLPASATLVIEPGRSMVARAGMTVYRVVSVKRGEPTFVAVDGGMGDNLEVSLYGQVFEAVAVDDALATGPPVELVGRHCESGDRLVSGALLPHLVPGDVVAVAATGAYCFTMANNYNGALRPPVVLCRDGEPRLVVRRETIADLLRRDVPTRRSHDPGRAGPEGPMSTPTGCRHA
ncbi:MAG: diaminopimelate decarboxylase [Actinomycetota bacterium]|nr:diaminopimelate decarboxylase [Actinomycetota bacterium]